MAVHLLAHDVFNALFGAQAPPPPQAALTRIGILPVRLLAHEQPERICRSLSQERHGLRQGVAELREQSRDKAEAIHLTKTPAGMSQWLKDNYGYEVSRKQISNWLNRGKLPSSKPVDGGYWEFNIREILAMAMGSSGRPA